MENVIFSPTRTAALERLRDFLPLAGRDYASLRNYDRPGHPHVSRLSPYLRHRVLTEEEVLAATLGRWSLSSAEKFVQEVVWRSYFKGWLERRPGVWDAYRQGVEANLNRIQTESGLRQDWEAACRGETGIDAFDHWAQELVATGYLHNHVRMWFASIWIFTLRLPWELGADFFLRHLLDGDPASNTLGWRWVAGLHTLGKHYVARPANIAKYTDDRFQPEALALSPEPLHGPPHPEPIPLRPTGQPDPSQPTGLILTEDDLSPGFAIGKQGIAATLLFDGTAGRSPLAVAPRVEEFAAGLIEDCVGRFGDRLGAVTRAHGRDAPDLVDWAQSLGLSQVVVPHLVVGPARDRLRNEIARLEAAGVAVAECRRPIDDLIWPHATAGFFKVKQRIPKVVNELGLI